MGQKVQDSAVAKWVTVRTLDQSACQQPWWRMGEAGVQQDDRGQDMAPVAGGAIEGDYPPLLEAEADRHFAGG